MHILNSIPCAAIKRFFISRASLFCSYIYRYRRITELSGVFIMQIWSEIKNGLLASYILVFYPPIHDFKIFLINKFTYMFSYCHISHLKHFIQSPLEEGSLYFSSHSGIVYLDINFNYWRPRFGRIKYFVCRKMTLFIRVFFFWFHLKDIEIVFINFFLGQ